MKNEYDFTIAVKNTDTFKKFERFKQGLILKRANIIILYDRYQQACRHGIEYLRQNPNILANDVKLIDEILKN
jgi:hypothetical protein